jgi:IS30 family transposase
MIEPRESGMPNVAIAKKLGRNRETVNKYIARHFAKGGKLLALSDCPSRTGTTDRFRRQRGSRFRAARPVRRCGR